MNMGDFEMQADIPSEEGSVIELPNTYDGLPHADRSPAKTFKLRQVRMMAIGVSIGTGMFYYSGIYLGYAGPVSLYLAYVVTGSILYSVLITIGEMISLLPIHGAIITLPRRFLTSGIGFACGWCYTMAYALDLSNKAVTFAIYMAYWHPDISPKIWIGIFIIFPFAFNFFNVRRYGEIEFFLTTIKVATIVGVVILGFVIVAGGPTTAPLLATNDASEPVLCSQNTTDCLSPPGFKYWKESAFKSEVTTGIGGYIAGFWDCCTLAVFCYTGNELLAVTAWETENPRRTLPKAVRRVSGRIILYYTSAVFFLGLTVSANDPLLLLPQNSDPHYQGGFIIMAKRAGIRIVPDIINVVMIIATISVATADLYVTSRCLQAMASIGFMGARSSKPARIMQAVNRDKVPYIALMLSIIPWAIAYLNLGVNNVPQNIYSFLFGMIGGLILIPWAILCCTYLSFRNAVRRGRVPTVSAADSPLQPWLAIWGLFWSTFVVVFQGFKAFLGPKSKYWNQTDQSWILALAGFGSLMFFLLLLLLSRLVIGPDAFVYRLLTPAEVLDGTEADQGEEKMSTNPWRRAIHPLLNFI